VGDQYRGEGHQKVCCGGGSGSPVLFEPWGESHQGQDTDYVFTQPIAYKNVINCNTKKPGGPSAL